MTHSVEQRIEEYTLPVPECGCLVWIGPEKHGYGYMSVKSKDVRMHKFMYEKVNGPVPEGLSVLHKCDVSLCVNAAHLYAGTHDENMDDRQTRNRQVKGERVNTAKLTRTQVAEIRVKHSTGLYRGTVLAAEYNVSPRMISQIVRRLAWASV